MNVSKFKLGMAMAEKEYTFSILAKLSGVSRTTLSAINNGKTCKADVLFKIAKALGVKPEQLITEEVS